jgi:hypothetical protein
MNISSTIPMHLTVTSHNWVFFTLRRFLDSNLNHKRCQVCLRFVNFSSLAKASEDKVKEYRMKFQKFLEGKRQYE